MSSGTHGARVCLLAACYLIDLVLASARDTGGTKEARARNVEQNELDSNGNVWGGGAATITSSRVQNLQTWECTQRASTWCGSASCRKNNSSDLVMQAARNAASLKKPAFAAVQTHIDSLFKARNLLIARSRVRTQEQELLHALAVLLQPSQSGETGFATGTSALAIMSGEQVISKRALTSPALTLLAFACRNEFQCNARCHRPLPAELLQAWRARRPTIRTGMAECCSALCTFERDGIGWPCVAPQTAAVFRSLFHG